MNRSLAFLFPDPKFDHLCVASRPDDNLRTISLIEHPPRVPKCVEDVLVVDPVTTGRTEYANGRQITVHRRRNVAAESSVQKLFSVNFNTTVRRASQFGCFANSIGSHGVWRANWVVPI